MPMLPPPPPAYLLLKGADVWTGEALRPGQAVVVKGSKILAVGPEGQLAKAHPKAQVVSLPGGTLLPGLIEGHAHVGGLGKLKAQVDLVGCQDLPEALGRVRVWGQAHPEGWVLGRGWDQNRWPTRAFPTALDLDRLTGTRPALLERVDGHAYWVNTAALDMAGITKDTPDPAGGTIHRDAEGRPTGILVDNAMLLVDKVVPAPSPAQTEAHLLAGLRALRAEGFTAVCDMGIGAADLAAYRNLATAGTLPIRVFAYLSHDQELMLKELKARPAKAVGWFQVQGVKFYLDGALGSRGARLLAPYADAAPSQGLWVTDPATVARDASITLRSGYQPAIHAIGDAANRAALDLLEQARRKAQNHVLPRIEHAQIVTAEDAARFGKAGIVASVQPVHCTSDHSWTPLRLGPERVGEAFPWRRFLEGKALLAFGSDAPVEDPNPFVSLAAAQTRQDPEGDPPGGFLPDQRLSPEEALSAYTAWNAKALGRADLGVIRAGAVADILWVNHTLPTSDAGALRKLRPGRLWVNGLEITP